MNRLSNYFENAKLAKLYYTQAQEYAKKDELKKAMGAFTTGQLYLLTAMNNVASIAFNQKIKKAVRS